MTEPLDAVRRRGAAGEVEAMEELARRYIEGVGVRADPFEGARWLMRAAERGAPGAMYNIGVMHERGMVLERDATKAMAWYSKAAAAGVPMAIHNMALMLRDGSGVTADPARATTLLLQAARQGMAASMYALAGMHEAGTHGTARDPVQAVMWYAMALAFQRAHPATQASELAARAEQKMGDLQRMLSPEELARAQALGEREYRVIIDAMREASRTQAKPAPPPPADTAPAAPVATAPAAGAPADTTATAAPPPAPVAKEQIAEIQKLLAVLKLYGGRPDGAMGPQTQAAIKQFQRTAGLAQTGEPSAALLDALRQRVAGTAPKR